MKQLNLCNRRLVAGLFVVAAALAPATTVFAAPPEQHLANCPNGPGVLVGVQIVGAYTSNCDLVVQPPAAMGAAPPAGAIIACRGIPGCLSNFVNNPGWVGVPNVDTRPRVNGVP